jgi:hypothetical protein
VHLIQILEIKKRKTYKRTAPKPYCVTFFSLQLNLKSKNVILLINPNCRNPLIKKQGCKKPKEILSIAIEKKE